MSISSIGSPTVKAVEQHGQQKTLVQTIDYLKKLGNGEPRQFDNNLRFISIVLGL